MENLNILKERTVSLFDKIKTDIMKNDIPEISALRLKAISEFKKTGFPDQNLEKWKNTDLLEVLNREYDTMFQSDDREIDIEKIFRCEVHNFETYLFTTLNGWYVYKNAPLTVFQSGTVVGSLSYAKQKYPEIFKQHYGKYAKMEGNGITSLNTAFSQDGIFIYVPDNVQVEKTIQMVNVINYEKNFHTSTRNLVVLGKNAKLTLVHCDDSISHQFSFLNTVTEVYVDENANVDFYKLQNKDDNATLITSTWFHQEANSNVASNTITLNGGILRNETYCALNGEGANAEIYGLYLMDRKQHVDNHIFIDHIKPNCRSTELFKGILDDDASAAFNGHVLVRMDAQKTNAFQTNRNILLSDTAKVNSKPFLEIYADDVKCSHGATIGQLDADAMFYLRSRGICERNSKMLLMYAFAAEVVNKISIEVLRERIDNMIVKRLKGELSICDQCVLHCKNDVLITFDLDMSKV